MTATSKFDASLARLRPQAHPPAAPAGPAPELTGRPMGKRSNPAYRPTTLILRKETMRAARLKLDARGDGADLSDLAEYLIAEWNARTDA